MAAPWWSSGEPQADDLVWVCCPGSTVTGMATGCMKHHQVPSMKASFRALNLAAHKSSRQLSVVSRLAGLHLCCTGSTPGGTTVQHRLAGVASALTDCIAYCMHRLVKDPNRWGILEEDGASVFYVLTPPWCKNRAGLQRLLQPLQ